MPGRYLPILKQAVRPRRFRALFLFVTSRCNSLCRTCFYSDKLNSRDDLTYEQILKLSDTAGPFEKLWLSGGEPFLRPELAGIITRFAHHNGVKNVNLPTNGLLPDKIFPVVDRVLADTPEEFSLDLNFSLDGVGATHDAIRGVPNNYRRTLDTIAQAEARYKNIRRLRRNVLSVITRENYHDIVRLGLELAAEGRIDGHYFEAVRGQAPDPTLKNLSTAELAELHRRLLPFHRHYAKKLFAHLSPGIRAFATALYLGNLKLHFDLHEACFEGPRRWPMPCTAGETTLVVDHNGRFRSCEMRDTIGSLADFDYDVQAALRSEPMREEVAAIRTANCWCTHSCFIQESAKFAPRVQLFSIPWAFVRQHWQRLPELDAEEMRRFHALGLA